VTAPNSLAKIATLAERDKYLYLSFRNRLTGNVESVRVRSSTPELPSGVDESTVQTRSQGTGRLSGRCRRGCIRRRWRFIRRRWRSICRRRRRDFGGRASTGDALRVVRVAKLTEGS